MAREAQRLVPEIHADSMRVGRYRWTITEDFQIHLYSPRSYATRGEAREDANKVIRVLAQREQRRDLAGLRVTAVMARRRSAHGGAVAQISDFAMTEKRHNLDTTVIVNQRSLTPKRVA
jgi:hypothetical protein